MLQPVKKYLLVAPLEAEQEQENLVLVPDDFKEKTNPYTFVKLLRGNDSTDLPTGYRLLVHAHLLEEVQLDGQVFHIIPENSVIAFVDSDL